MLVPQTTQANAGWPALYVAIAPLEFYPLTMICTFLEAAIYRSALRIEWSKALLLSVSANLCSLVVGIGLATYGIFLFGDSTPLGLLYEASVLVAWFVLLLITIASEWCVLRFAWGLKRNSAIYGTVIGNIVTYLSMLIIGLYATGISFQDLIEQAAR